MKKPGIVVCVLLVLAAGRVPCEIKASLPEGAYAQDRLAFFSSDKERAALYYRFEGGSALHPLEGALELSALPGEERPYSVFVEARGRDGSVESASFRYSIDKKPPEAPEANPGPGMALPGTSVSLASRDAARLSWALSPRSAAARNYEGPVPLQADERGVSILVLSAVAYDALGNASLPRSFTYVCAPAGVKPASEYLSRDSKLIAPVQARAESQASVSRQTDGVLVSFFRRDASSFQWRILGGAEELGQRSIPARDGTASLLVKAPPQWVGAVRIEWRSVIGADGAVEGAQAIEAAFAETAEPPSRDSALARLVPAIGARGAWFVADEAEGRIRFKANEGTTEDYSGPAYVAAPEGRDSVRVQYFLFRPDGSRSMEIELSLAVPPDPGRPSALGLPENGVSGTTVSLSPGQGSILLRYESVTGGTDPIPVTSLSPVLEAGTRFDAPEGKTVVHVVRLRSFLSADREARGGNEAIARFIVDRTPPSPPEIKELPGHEALADKRFGFPPSEDTIYVQVFREGQALGGYSPYEGPLVLKADPNGSITYSLSAYAVDKAGNRSAESRRSAITIDSTSVYASELGSDSNDGSPTAPVASLEAALRIALVTARGRIRVRGEIKGGEGIPVDGRVEIEGGFDEEWKRDASRRSVVHAKSLIVRRGGNLSATGIEFSVAPERGEAALKSEGGRIFFKDAAFRAECRSSAEGIVLLAGSRLEARDAEFSLRGKGVFTGIVSEDSIIAFFSSVLSVSGSLVGTGISSTGESISVKDSTLSCSSVQSSAVLAFAESTFSLERAFLESRAESGFASVIMERDSSGVLDTCVVKTSKSAESLFFDCSGGYLRLAHVTAFAEGKPRAAYGFRMQGVSLNAVNSAFAALGEPDSGALFDGGVDPKGLSALMYAGFKSLSRGGNGEALKARVAQAQVKDFFEIDAKGMPRLGPASPLIDRGLAATEGQGRDWYGNPRPSRSGKGLPDIGAFERQ